MNLLVRKLVVLTAGVTAFAAAGAGQSAQPVGSVSGRMFAGETLKYEAKINKILRGISVAELTFSAAALPGTGELLIKSKAVSKGTLLKLFRYDFLQEYDSLMDTDRFRILRTTKHDVQKDRVRNSVAEFDYRGRRVTFVETNPKEPMSPPRRIASEIGDQLHDMISAVYAVRLLPLVVGKKYEFSVSDSGLVYKVPFTVTAREQQKTILGKVWCWRVEPDIFGPGRLIEQKGSMVIWMTDDERHLPVRAEVQSSLGKLDIKLRSYIQDSSAAAKRP
ncbi:MAG TPA: DUF3108 domain-containing protein [Pyrinomonadaceae bacterium]|nr:DUF3108 domain-containing protein [Pyrinomonadaceae bacterium]